MDGMNPHLRAIAYKLGITLPLDFPDDGQLCAAIIDKIGEMEQARLRRQRIVTNWCHQAFGADQCGVKQRALRMLEESVEAYQAAGCDEEMGHRLVSYVFNRAPGNLAQELGGVGLTVLALAEAASLNADDEERLEIARVLAKPLSHFVARNQSKNDAGFDTRVRGK